MRRSSNKAFSRDGKRPVSKGGRTSKRQRRRAIVARRKAERDRAAQEIADRKHSWCNRLNEGGLAVDRGRLAPDNSYGVPNFVARGYYLNLPFACKDCGKQEVWNARQQKWWYEVAKGGVWTTAVRCRPCRRQERERREEARRVHLDGLAHKRANR
ncbi:hypothetical protein Pla123a_16600 [Posidoniimonas polymericola]|uniref:Probable zinc-binding domain-containing protein n=1 Tax=Posidoniimonas polymericola TaxID=2528002 RepID=A0A5C5YSA7_9BACT|nr:zinc-ribbon domain containing protein [Posidoniimonas polymericola]TWT77862.1 hypothetical protein Pla123a_16600 [Posidoniimonas polymericola]